MSHLAEGGRVGRGAGTPRPPGSPPRTRHPGPRRLRPARHLPPASAPPLAPPRGSRARERDCGRERPRRRARPRGHGPRAPFGPAGEPQGVRAAQSPIVAGGWPPQTGFCSSANSAAGTTDCGRAGGGLRARPGARGSRPSGGLGPALAGSLPGGPAGFVAAESGKEQGRNQPPRLPHSAESSTRPTPHSRESWRTELPPQHNAQTRSTERSPPFAKEQSRRSPLPLPVPLFSHGQRLKSNFYLLN